MEAADFTLNLTSEDPDRLAAFYSDVVGLPRDEEIGGFSFKAGPARLRISGHSDTKGPNKEPSRFLINFFVGDVESELSRLRDLGVPVIRSATRENWGGLVSTLADPDGNYIQLIEP